MKQKIDPKLIKIRLFGAVLTAAVLIILYLNVPELWLIKKGEEGGFQFSLALLCVLGFYFATTYLTRLLIYWLERPTNTQQTANP
jgi:ABC-type uncharacterized transport system permease subunit